MIQDKVNQLLGIDALITKGVQSDIKERMHIQQQTTESLKEFTGVKTIDDLFKPTDTRSDIHSMKQEIERQGNLQEQICEQFRNKHKAMKQAESNARFELEGWEAAEEEIENQEEAMRMRGIQSMQGKGQSLFMQRYDFRALINDLANSNEDTQSISNDVANALKKERPSHGGDV